MLRWSYAVVVAAPMAVLILTGGCGSSSQVRFPSVVGEPVVFPAPPEQPRLQFLTSFSNSIDITGARGGFASRILGPDEGQPISKPYGLAIHNGRLYICDTITGTIVIIDLERRSFKYFNPSGQGKLQKPLNCAVDAAGRLYVADRGRGQVVIFDRNGKYLAAIGDMNTDTPTGVSVSGGRIWVTDVKTQQIKVYDQATYSRLFTFPDADPARPEFLHSPTNVAVAGDRVYVTDFGDFRVKIYDTNGAFIKAIGSYGDALGQFARPKGIGLDRNHILYVVDAAFENVQMFDRDGNLLMILGGPYTGPGYMWLPAGVLVDYDNLSYFEPYVAPGYRLQYLVLVTNQFGPDKVNVYGFLEAGAD